MKKFNELITKFEELISKVGVMAIVLIIFLNSILRYFKRPLVWAPDIAQLIFVWIIFIGADLALQQNKHIGVEIIEAKLSPKNRSLLKILWGILIILFLGLCVYFGVKLCIANSSRRLNGGVQISYSYLTSAVPFGALLMIKTTIINTISEFRSLKNNIKKNVKKRVIV